MGATSHYVVKKRDHPGSTAQEIRDEPDWGAGHNHRVGFKNRDNRIPGYTDEAKGKYLALQEREQHGDLVNFRDVINGQEDLHLIHPQDRSLGWRYQLQCTEDWVKYGQKWPANEKAKAKQQAADQANKTDKDSDNDDDEKEDSKSDGNNKNDQQHGDLKLKTEDQMSAEETALLRVLQHEKDYMVHLKVNPGNLESPQKRNRTDISIDEADQFTPDNWFPRSKDLIRLTGKHPMNAEPNLTNLLDAGLITPNELHYVRNHGPVPQLLWELHTVQVDVGSPDGPAEFHMDDLKHKFRSTNIPVFLACDGNRRKELNLIRRSKGFDWGAGGGGCAYWKGALLRDVLLAAGLRDQDVNGRTDFARKWVNFEGSEQLAEGTYQTCIPLAYAMDDRNDVLLAYEMNDLPLPPDHGYPVRVMIPGYVGGRCVKWLRRVWVSETENDSHYHVWDNRVLPSFVTDTESPYAETLYRHPGTACYEQNLNSVIVRPQQGEKIFLADVGRRSTRAIASQHAQGDGCAPGEYRVKGFAYDGGGHEVQRVEVSLDDGENWLYCIRQFPEYPIRHGKKFWTWCHWHVDVSLARLVQARSITVRCFNVFKNSQPKKPAWNLHGMMNNCWYTVKSEIITPAADSGFGSGSSNADSGGAGDGSDGDTNTAHDGAYVFFRHPVEPARGSDGWMKPSVVNQVEAAKREAGTPSKQFTREEVEKHDTETDCWLVVDNKVYDATSVLSWHPGGKAAIMPHAGRVHQETSDEFWSIHDDYASDKLKECLLGVVTDKAAQFIHANAKRAAAEKAKQQSGHSEAALQKHRWVPTKLIRRQALSDDTRSYIFQLPDHKAILGLSTCKHIQVGFHMKDKMVIRSYTPVRPILPPPRNTAETLADVDAKTAARYPDEHIDQHDGGGTFELVVKTYFPTSEQPGGAMSNILDCMPVGEEVEIRGPTGEIEYQGDGKFLIEGQERTYRRVSLVLGGSGVTPGYALIARIVLEQAETPDSKVEVRVVDANKTENDILMRKEMEEFETMSHGALRITHVLSHPPENWDGLGGHVNEDILKQHLFGPGDETAVFVCGPPTMLKMAVMPALRGWGYQEDKDLFGF